MSKKRSDDNDVEYAESSEALNNNDNQNVMLEDSGSDSDYNPFEQFTADSPEMLRLLINNTQPEALNSNNNQNVTLEDSGSGSDYNPFEQFTADSPEIMNLATDNFSQILQIMKSLPPMKLPTIDISEYYRDFKIRLNDYGATPSTNANIDLWDAMHSNDNKELQSAIEDGADINNSLGNTYPGPYINFTTYEQEPPKKVSPLTHLAAAHGNKTQQIKILARNGVNINQINEDFVPENSSSKVVTFYKQGYYTPLHAAVRENKTDNVELLLKLGADPDIIIPNEGENNLLRLIVTNNCKNMVQYNDYDFLFGSTSTSNYKNIGQYNNIDLLLAYGIKIQNYSAIISSKTFKGDMAPFNTYILNFDYTKNIKSLDALAKDPSAQVEFEYIEESFNIMEDELVNFCRSKQIFAIMTKRFTKILPKFHADFSCKTMLQELQKNDSVPEELKKDLIKIIHNSTKENIHSLTTEIIKMIGYVDVSFDSPSLSFLIKYSSEIEYNSDLYNLLLFYREHTNLDCHKVAEFVFTKQKDDAIYNEILQKIWQSDLQLLNNVHLKLDLETLPELEERYSKTIIPNTEVQQEENQTVSTFDSLTEYYDALINDHCVNGHLGLFDYGLYDSEMLAAFDG